MTEHTNHHILAEERTFLGFWIYLMTDLLMFAALFAAYVVLHGNTNGGASSSSLFDLPFALIETLLLLTSSFTCGIGILFAKMGKIKPTLIFFGITFALGISFLAMEISEFSHLWIDGNTFQKSAFLSSFFTLVGTHGLHIFFGLFWMLLIFISISRRGFTENALRKLTLLSLFWHFLDIVWIFIFTLVYLMGVI